MRMYIRVCLCIRTCLLQCMRVYVCVRIRVCMCMCMCKCMCMCMSMVRCRRCMFRMYGLNGKYCNYGMNGMYVRLAMLLTASAMYDTSPANPEANPHPCLAKDVAVARPAECQCFVVCFVVCLVWACSPSLEHQKAPRTVGTRYDQPFNIIPASRNLKVVEQGKAAPEHPRTAVGRLVPHGVRLRQLHILHGRPRLAPHFCLPSFG